MQEDKTRKYYITKNTYGSGDFTSTEYAIRNREMNVSSEVIDNQHEILPNGRAIWVNTSASGRLTIEQAEAFVKVIERAIEDAKSR